MKYHRLPFLSRLLVNNPGFAVVTAAGKMFLANMTQIQCQQMRLVEPSLLFHILLLLSFSSAGREDTSLRFSNWRSNVHLIQQCSAKMLHFQLGKVTNSIKKRKINLFVPWPRKTVNSLSETRCNSTSKYKHSNSASASPFGLLLACVTHMSTVSPSQRTYGSVFKKTVQPQFVPQ